MQRMVCRSQKRWWLPDCLSGNFSQKLSIIRSNGSLVEALAYLPAPTLASFRVSIVLTGQEIGLARTVLRAHLSRDAEMYSEDISPNSTNGGYRLRKVTHKSHSSPLGNLPTSLLLNLPKHPRNQCKRIRKVPRALEVSAHGFLLLGCVGGK